MPREFIVGDARVAIICVVSVFLCVRALAQEAYYGGLATIGDTWSFT